MHGFLWALHKDHHQSTPGFLEKNDFFFLIFALPSSLLMVFGSLNGIDYRFFIGLGILVYGCCYFLVHDVLIHKRFKWIKQIRNPYFKALVKAHYVHHKNKNKAGSECFGMLVVPYRFFKK
jgi:beta-carotene 3-hydroxylase